MGKRGPAPAPTALKLLKGEKRSRINENEPKPSGDAAPSHPAWLSPDARRVWRRYAPDLWAKGVLTEWDREAFAVWCTAVVTHRDAARSVDELGVMIPGDRGVVKHPALQIIRDQAAIIRAYAQEFGLTPSARSSLKTGEVDGGDLFDV